MEDRKEHQNGETKHGKLKKVEKTPSELHREYLDMDTDEEEFGRPETPEPEEELPPEPEKPIFSDQELNTLVQYIKDLTILYALEESDWNEECYEVIREYFRDPTKVVLTIFYKVNVLTALLDFPNSAVAGLTYFLRSPWQIYTTHNFLSTVLFGSVNERVENVMLKLIENIYAPIIMNSSEWPQTVRDNAYSNVHSLLISLTDATYKLMGLTILYVPREGIQIQRSKLLNDDCFALSGKTKEKLDTSEDENIELTGRLEKIARYWMRQIQEALLNTTVKYDHSSIIDEIAFWNYRYDNLNCLHYQLLNKNILSIIEKLENVQSTSVQEFQPLAAKVQKAVEEATSNIMYLNILLDSCKDLQAPEEVDVHIHNILLLIQFIWIDSPFYNTTDRIETLCRALSTQIINQCREYIDLDIIFDDDANEGRSMLEICISCCQNYKIIYDRLVDITPDINPKKNWDVNREIVFNHLDTFIQRCRDVIEICDAMVVFGRCNEMRKFPGAKGTDHEKNCWKIENLFYQNLNKIRDVYDDILDVMEFSWLDCITEFRHQMTELENMVRNLIDDIFRDVQNVEEGIEALYMLQRFKQRQYLQEILYNKWVEVWKIFSKELEDCTTIMIEKSKAYNPSISYYNIEWTTMLRIKQNYLTRQHTMLINASDWLGDYSVQTVILQKYKHLMATMAMKEQLLLES